MGKNYVVAELNNISRESIQLAFVELLEKKRIDEISISEICFKAGVSRNAYYRNFQSKENVLEKHLEMITADFFNSSDKSDYKAYYEALFNHFTENRKILNILHKNRLDYLIFDVFNKFSYNPIDSNTSDDILNRFTTGGIYFVIMDWIESDMKKPAAEMAEIIFDYKMRLKSQNKK